MAKNEKNFELIINEMNQFINIDKDREKYAKCFSTLTKDLFEILRKDEAFKTLYNGFQLGGGYGDNLKVSLPDEYDMVFFLRLPESSRAKITKDPQIPGNVFIDLTDVFEQIQKHKHYNVICTLLKKFVTPSNRLIVDKLQNWLDGCFQKAVNELGTKFGVDGYCLEFRKTRCGPAHTFWVNGTYKFSVDFVPAIQLNATQSVLTSNLRNEHQWEAIPKPLKQNCQYAKGNRPMNCSFRGSFYTAENNLIKDCHNFKNAVRYMKKFRNNHQNMSNLKSYYIKTLFLWKLKKEGNSYFRKPISVVICEMFQELQNSLAAQKLLYYWDPNLNMFKDLTKKQCMEMYNYVCNANRRLQVAKIALDDYLKMHIYHLFLSEDEIAKLLDGNTSFYSGLKETSNEQTTAEKEPSSCIVT